MPCRAFVCPGEKKDDDDDIDNEEEAMESFGAVGRKIYQIEITSTYVY